MITEKHTQLSHPTNKGKWSYGKGGSFIISWGKYGGFYIKVSKDWFHKRICLGWLAITYLPIDYDVLLKSFLLGDDK